MNGEVCCILGVCCPPGSEERLNGLAKEAYKDIGDDGAPGQRVSGYHGLTEQQAKMVAAWVLNNFDLAPKGMLSPFVTEITRMARLKP